MLQRLKTFSTDQVDLEELIFLAMLADAMAETYTNHDVDQPEWLTARQKELTREISARVEDQRVARVKNIKARLESMKPESVKRNELKQELAKLEKQLQD